MTKDFFLEFAIVEFLMVEKGIVVINGDDFVVKVDWPKLYDNLSLVVAPNLAIFIENYKSLALDDPPKQLKYYQSRHYEWVLPHNDVISAEQFEAMSTGEKFRRITKSLCRVRNNLFHGGKLRDPSAWTNNRLLQCFPIVKDLKTMIIASNWREPRQLRRNEQIEE